MRVGRCYWPADTAHGETINSMRCLATTLLQSNAPVSAIARALQQLSAIALAFRQLSATAPKRDLERNPASDDRPLAGEFILDRSP
jgi:hypothetical protein